MSRTTLFLASLIFALPLAACGGSGAGNSAAGEEKVADAGGSSASWKATDACSIIDKAEMGAAIKVEVTETSLALVNEANGPNAATSECTYLLKDGGRASVMTRWSPINDNTDDAIKMARSTLTETVKAFGKTIEEVPGVGKAAFFVPGINQLNVYLDDARMMIITVPGGAEGKDQAIALAKQSM